MKFTKMQGAGNDYVYVNGFEETVADKPAAAIKVSDRHFGIGSDGLIFINPSKVAEVEMEMYNSDGSRAEMCGNGTRCVAKYAYDNGLVNSKEFGVETLAGIKHVTVRTENDKAVAVTVDMGAPILEAEKVPCDKTCFAGESVIVPDGFDAEKMVVNRSLTVMDKEYKVTCVSMGNPHAVVFIDQDVREFPLEKIGPVFEVHKAFPRKTNTEFVRLIDRKTVEMRVWERGAGETLACGTGACAVAVACILNGYTDNEVTVKLLGGDLKISWDMKGSVYMEGPAVTVFTGEIEL